MEEIKFTKINIKQFNQTDQKDFVAELRKRKIRFKLSSNAVYFDERFDKQIRDLIPKNLR